MIPLETRLDIDASTVFLAITTPSCNRETSFLENLAYAISKGKEIVIFEREGYPIDERHLEGANVVYTEKYTGIPTREKTNEMVGRLDQYLLSR